MISNHFNKIIEELLDNAFKFSSENGIVEINAEVKEDSYLVSIKNTGIEFTRIQIEQIGGFMQFNRKYIEQQGIGLGLAIVKMILEIYQAKFSIESFNGHTKIELILPLLD